jgi:hypothetical protein
LREKAHIVAQNTIKQQSHAHRGKVTLIALTKVTQTAVKFRFSGEMVVF